MKRSTFRLVILVATISILGVGVIQVYWFRQAFSLEEQRFNREVNSALINVASQFAVLDSATTPANPIQQMSSSYYVVMVNNEIDANLLEYLLRTEFRKRDLEADFEYGIYDCTNDEMVYGNYVSFSNITDHESTSLPKWEDQPYYFGVNFPQRLGTLINRLDIWIFSSVVLFIVVIFFSYALWVIFRQKRLSEIQKDFINNMTHEFKTPISTIAISANVLKDPSIIQTPERLSNYASIIENENNRMKKQVERVLQIATVDTNIEFKREKVNCVEWVEDVLDSMGPGLEKAQAIIEKDFSESEIYISGDLLHLSNVLFNLIDNSVKYCNTQPKIKISVIKKRGNIELFIEDNGIGIPAREHKKIFNRFYRISTGNVHDVKGFGLGLSYVRQVIESIGGQISLEDSTDIGTCFKITLPEYEG